MNLEELLSNTEVVIGEEELAEKLASGQKLKVKFGVDPTRPDLTFGHLVVFNKLKQFQDAGHEAILLIGDYTAQIGDPSGRSELRPELTEEEVSEYAKTYLDQAFRILDSEKTIVRRNSEWFGSMTFADALNLSRKMTVARMLERDDFEKYEEDKQKYRELMKMLNDGTTGYGGPSDGPSDELLMSFYRDGQFQPPVYRYKKKPCMAILFDDCLGSQIFTSGIRKLNALTIYHRHLGSFKKGGALGCSLFFLVQSYKAQSGGISKCIRGNTTSLAVGRTKSERELEEIAEECGAEVPKSTFLKMISL